MCIGNSLFISNVNCFFFSLGSYELADAEGVQRGTKIVVHLKGDCYDYAREEMVRGMDIQLRIV